jgi:hypothetical protein
MSFLAPNWNKSEDQRDDTAELRGASKITSWRPVPPFVVVRLQVDIPRHGGDFGISIQHELTDAQDPILVARARVVAVAIFGQKIQMTRNA